MRFICLDIPLDGVSIDDYKPHMVEEASYGWELYKSEFIREVFYRKDRLGVVLIAESESVESCYSELKKFPLCREGVIDWQIIPVGPFMGWESLFSVGQ